MRFREFFKKSQVHAPGSHGSHRWYINLQGEVVYGDPPKMDTQRRAPGDMWSADEIKDGVHFWHQAPHGRYLVNYSTGEVLHAGGDTLHSVGYAHWAKKRGAPVYGDDRDDFEDLEAESVGWPEHTVRPTSHRETSAPDFVEHPRVTQRARHGEEWDDAIRHLISSHQAVLRQHMSKLFSPDRRR